MNFTYRENVYYAYDYIIWTEEQALASIKIIKS